MMIGYHAVPVIVDAYFKNIPMDVKLAYEACRASAMVDEREIDLSRPSGPAASSRSQNRRVDINYR